MDMTVNGVQYYRSRLFETTALTPVATQFGGGGKGTLGIVLGAVASIFIPVIAGPIATVLFGGGALATTLTGAALGAAAGAGGAAIGGGNVLRGALLGGIGAGLTTGLSQAGGLSGIFGGGEGATAVAAAPTAAPAGVTTMADLPAYGATAVEGTATGAIPTISDGVTTPVSQALSGADVTQLGANTAASSAPAATGAPMQLKSAVQPGLFSGLNTDKITSGLMLAAPGLVSAALGGGQQTALMKQAQAELEALRGQDSAAYEERKKVYDEMFRNAQSIDPQFMQRQATTDVFRSLAQQERERVAGINTQGGAAEDAYRAAEARRANVEGTAAAIGAGNRALLGGIQTRDVAMRNVAAAVPRPSAAGLQYTTQLAGMFGQQERQQAQGIGQALGAFSYPFLTDQMQRYVRPSSPTYNIIART